MTPLPASALVQAAFACLPAAASWEVGLAGLPCQCSGAEGSYIWLGDPPGQPLKLELGQGVTLKGVHQQSREEGACSGSSLEVRLHKTGGCWARGALCSQPCAGLCCSLLVFKQSVAGHDRFLGRTSRAGGSLVHAWVPRASLSQVSRQGLLLAGPGFFLLEDQMMFASLLCVSPLL